jgi:hypothetical protein
LLSTASGLVIDFRGLSSLICRNDLVVLLHEINDCWGAMCISAATRDHQQQRTV